MTKCKQNPPRPRSIKTGLEINSLTGPLPWLTSRRGTPCFSWVFFFSRKSARWRSVNQSKSTFNVYMGLQKSAFGFSEIWIFYCSKFRFRKIVWFIWLGFFQIFRFDFVGPRNRTHLIGLFTSVQKQMKRNYQFVTFTVDPDNLGQIGDFFGKCIATRTRKRALSTMNRQIEQYRRKILPKPDRKVSIQDCSGFKMVSQPDFH